MKPIVTSFKPKGGTPGSKIVIKGSGFTGATAVQFGGYDALCYFIINDQTIEAYIPIQGTGTVGVGNASGISAIPGFTSVQTRVKLPDLPDIGRAADPNDLIYVWGNFENKLFKSQVSRLPFGSGSGSGGGGTIPVYTALGSPFKIRTTDDGYYYNATLDQVEITDPRLLGKTDYIVSATDRQAEFENYNSSTGEGNLEFDDVNGKLIIHQYQLSDDKHISIYADGVTTTAIQDFVLKQQAQLDSYKKALSPFIPTYDSTGALIKPAGGIVAWGRPESEIPQGWQEWLPGRGAILVGRDPNFAFDPDTMQDDLSAANGTLIGSDDGVTILEENEPYHEHHIFARGQPGNNVGDVVDANGFNDSKLAWTTAKKNGNQDYDIKVTPNDNEAKLGTTSGHGNKTPVPLIIPRKTTRIVNYITPIS